MVDISSQNNKVSITVSSGSNTANVNATPDSARYYSDKSKEWAISDKIVDNADYSSKYYANESKKQADISTAKATEVIESGNTAVSNIESAKDNAITDITNQETTSKTVLIDEGATQIGLIQNEGATQVNLAKEQVTLATEQANIATEQATIATSQASIATSKTTEVVESGNTALSNIETAKSNALNDINTTGAEYVNNAEQYAQNALDSANNAKASEDNALSYKNSAMGSSQTATEKANIATQKAEEATTSANNAKTSETNAKSSETRCEEIFSRLGTAIKIKGRVDSLSDLPLSGNLDGDTYLVGEEGLDSYPEYYWYQDHWEFLGTSGTSLSWGLITGDITAQTDLQTALNSKQDVISDLATIRSGAAKGATALQSIPAEYVTETELNANISELDNNVVHKTGDETVAGTKTFNNTIVGSVNGNANTATNDIDGNPIKTTYQKVSNLSQVINESTTKYPSCNAVKTAIDAKDSLPSQTGNAGKFLTTDGTNASWKNSYTPPLLSCMWSDHLLSDMSWLRADTFSWQDGTTYSLIYNELLSEYNNSASTAEKEGSIIFKRTPKGYKIALPTQETAILNKYNSDGIAWYYILDTTNTRFKLPRTKYGFEGLRTNVGNDIEAGLPNITGKFNSAYNSDNLSGAFGWQGNMPTQGATNSSFTGGMNFDASRSSSIYGNSDTVQPPATQMYLYFYVGNYTQSAIQQTAGLNSELFNNKLDLNANNLDTNGKSLISGLSMPSNKYTNLTLGASGSIYIAPANGWYFLSLRNGSANTYSYMNNITSNNVVGGSILVGITEQRLLPVKKGDSVMVTYGAIDAQDKVLRFVYAEGSK